MHKIDSIYFKPASKRELLARSISERKTHYRGATDHLPVKKTLLEMPEEFRECEYRAYMTSIR